MDLPSQMEESEFRRREMVASERVGRFFSFIGRIKMTDLRIVI